MRFVILGTAGYHGNESRQTASLLFPELGLVFDAGTSLFRMPDKLRTAEVSIYLSHAHLDHIAGLTYLLVPLIRGQIRSATVWGLPEYMQAVQEHLFSRLVFPLVPDCQWNTLPETGSHAVAQDGVLRWQRLPSHQGGSTAYRVDWPGRSFAYVTDTTVDDSYTEFIRGVDVLVHECNFPDRLSEWGPKTGHSWTTAVANLAREADVGRLILTHLDPYLPENDPLDLATARGIFPRTEVAVDGYEVTW